MAVTIKDIAEELGVSTATVSNVIHGKTKKISKETVRRVQALLEERQYIPNMAALLLAQNSSKIICLVISAHEKYEDKLLQDPFITSLLDHLATEIESSGYFMMIKRTKDINEVIRYASMWNMAGLVITGFCSSQDYDELRRNIRIPFVVMDGGFKPHSQCVNIGIDNADGGYQVGQYLIKMGHRDVLYVADNDMDMDHERYMGLRKAYEETSEDLEGFTYRIQFRKIALTSQELSANYGEILKEIQSENHKISAIFCASDVYAIELMNHLLDHHIQIPEEISIVGFDDIPAATLVRPKLTTVRQNIKQRAEEAMRFLSSDTAQGKSIMLEVELVKRESVSYREAKN